jgi:arylamine N-acetyltransferase
MLTREQTRGYLQRLGIAEIQYPDKHFLFELHKAHIEKIPWSTVDIFAGKPHPIDYKSSIQLILNHKSGYCFHLNGAFSQLLRSLGYQVTLHRAGVQSNGADPRVDSFHLGLIVHLPNEESQIERWIVDVGLGDMPYEPLPLKSGVYPQEPFTYKVTYSEVVMDGWRLVHDPLAAFAGVDYDPNPVSDIAIFESKHHHLSRSPESTWINLLLLRNRHSSGSYELRGCIFTQRDKTGIQKREITHQSEWLEIIEDLFGVRLSNYTALERDQLWEKAMRAHEAWKMNQKPSTTEA